MKKRSRRKSGTRVGGTRRHKCAYRRSPCRITQRRVVLSLPPNQLFLVRGVEADSSCSMVGWLVFAGRGFRTVQVEVGPFDPTRIVKV